MKRPTLAALRTITLSLAATLVACSTAREKNNVAVETPPQQPLPSAEAKQSRESVRADLRSFGAAYGYDVGYLERLLDLSPGAQRTFAAAMAMAEHREELPVDAHFVALISALMADDCGACTQLNLKMAVEAGVDRGLLRQLLQDPSALPDRLRLVHDYATMVVKGKNVSAETLAQLQSTYGPAGLGELAVNVIGARIYPALRRSMGAEFACAPPTVDF